MWDLRFVVGVLSCAVIVLSPTPIVQAHEDNSPSFSVVVMGGSGSGVSSTVQELIGSLTQCPPLTGHATLNPKILEYTLSSIASPNGSEKYSFKLIEVPELAENSTLKEEAEIFASLKAYLQTDNVPKIFLVLSSFVDEDFENDNSKFIHLLQRVQFFQQSFLSKERSLASTGTMFLLSHLMDERLLWQIRPQAKLMVFRAIVEEFTSFPQPIFISVGESRREKVEKLKKESGYHVLPNKELFPKNVWENILSLSLAWNNSQVVQDTIATFMKEGRVSENIVCDTGAAFRDWEFLNEDVQDFTYFLERKLNCNLVVNGINSEIDQHQGSLQKIALQIRLQDLGIETRVDLPTTHLGRMKLLDKIPLGVGAIILKKQFGLKMPEYKHPLSVGFGYNLLKDEALTSTPFRKEFLIPNALGYQFPAFMDCTRMPEERQKYFAEIVDSYSEYVSERLKSLHLPGNFVPESAFSGHVRAGFNIKEKCNDNATATVSVLKEIRKVKCTLKESIILQREILADEFQDAVNNITKFDQTSRESVNSWRTFFERFGSHIASSSYGGGYFHAAIPLNCSDDEFNIMLGKIKTQFSPWINSGIQIRNKWESGGYSFHGGNLNSHEDDLNESKLETVKLNKLLGSWATSLTNDFVMLNHDIELQPISFVVGLHNETKGEMVRMTLEKLLSGELRYVERKEVEAWKDEARWWRLASESDEVVDPSVGQDEGNLLENMLNVSSSRCGGLLDGHSGWVDFSADALSGEDTPSSCMWTIRANNNELIKLKAQLFVENNNSHSVLNASVIEIKHDMKNGSVTPQIISTRLFKNEAQIYFGPVIFVVLSRANGSIGRFQLQFERIGDGNSEGDHQTIFNYKTFEGSVGRLSGTDLEPLSSSAMKLNDTESTKTHTSTFVSVVFPNASTNVQLEAVLGERNEWCSAGSSFIVLSHIEENSPRLRDYCKSDRRGENLINKAGRPFLIVIRKRVEESMDFNLTWRRWTRRDELNSGIGSWTNVTVQNDYCGGVVIGKEGHLQYKLGRKYDDNERCLWLLHSPTSFKITITLLRDGFEGCCDYIEVHAVDPENALLGNGSRIEATRTFEGSVLAILFTDFWLTGTGFLLQFTMNGENINPEYSYKLRHTSPTGITKYPDYDWEDDDDGEGIKEIILIASKLEQGSAHYSMAAWQRDISKFVGTSFLKSRTNCTYDKLTIHLDYGRDNLTYNLPYLAEHPVSCPYKIKIPDMKDLLSYNLPGVLAIYKPVQDPVDFTNM